MLYQKLKSLLVLFAFTTISFWGWGCSQESDEEQVKGEEIVLVEKAYDFLDNLRTAEVVSKNIDFVSVEKSLYTIKGEARLVLGQHPNSEVVFENIFIEQNTKLEFGIGINQPAWDKPGDGVVFEIHIVDEESQDILIFSKYIDPKNNIEDRKWFDEEVDLNNFSGQEVSFVFKTTGGSKGNISYDWSGWSNARITSEAELALADYPIRFETIKHDLIEEFADAEIVPNPNSAAQIEKVRLNLNSNSQIGGEEREVILTSPPSEFSYQLKIPDNAFLEVGIGVGAESHAKEVAFEVYVNNNLIFSRDVAGGRKDACWLDQEIDLSKYSGEKVDLRFKALANPKNQAGKTRIMAGWSHLRIIETIPVTRNLSSKDRPNVILMVLDTQRADHLSCYGYHRDTSPTLSQFAEQGILFENAISQSSWTWPATASILTGLYPYGHGVTNDESSFLVNSIVTLAEILEENHFTTFGLSGNPLISKDKNFDQGFATFIEVPWARAEHLNHRFLKWLDRNKKLQFFAYLHYMDPHDPYRAPGEYYDMFDPDYKGKYNFRKGNDVRNAVNPLWKAINYGLLDIEYTGRDIEHLAALYDGEIRYWDNQFSILLESLKELNILNKTIIVITSDHGEEFLEHGKLKHRIQLYDETIKVPLVIWFPDIIEGKRIPEQVETVAIYATLCKMLGIEIPKDIQGESLLPGINAKSRNSHAYSQTEHAFIFGRETVTKNSVRTREWKLIHTPSENEYELYDLLEDNGELKNLFGSHLGIENDLKSKLEEWVSKTKKIMPETRRGIDQQTMKKLRSLGYIR